MRLLKYVFVLVIVSVVAAKHLVVLPAGPWKEGEKSVKPLPWGSKICPRDYKNGFTFECRNNMVPPVKWYINDKLVRTTYAWPYTITQYANNKRSKYKVYGPNISQKIECKSSHGGPKQTSQITYQCNGPRKVSTKQSVKKTPVRPSSSKKWYFKGGQGCVIVDATTPVSGLKPGWTLASNGGVVYQKDNPMEGVVAPGTAPLTYVFRVSKKSQYGITLDMETGSWTEHNDVFLKFTYGGGLRLYRPGHEKIVGSQFTKAYHNKNGRHRQAKSVDNFGHSFSTVAELEPGVDYYITIGARSTKLTVHNIILFPCSDGQCTEYDNHWKWMLGTCS